MNQSPPPHSLVLAEASELIEKMFIGGTKSPPHFADLVQFLLVKTVLAEGQRIVPYRFSGNSFTLSGEKRTASGSTAPNRDVYAPLKLNDDRYLYLRYDCYLNPKKNDYITIRASSVSYQTDFDGSNQIFRFDYNRVTQNKYPSSHLHVYGNWLESSVGVKMHHVHFPVIRATIEAIIRLLIHEFKVPTNTTEDIWQPLLQYTENRFIEIATKTRTPESDKQ